MFLITNYVPYSHGMEEKEGIIQLMHLKDVQKEFENDKDEIKFKARKNRIEEYYNTDEYELEVKVICNAAKNHFEQLCVTEKSLIIFDVDDTALYNLFTRKRSELYLSEPLTKAILPVLNLYNDLLYQGFKIIFITGRKALDRKTTKNELKNAGYEDFDDLICLPERYLVNALYKEPVAEWKCNVRKDLAQYYEIVGTVGDRHIDFIGGYSGHIVKLPNYFY